MIFQRRPLIEKRKIRRGILIRPFFAIHQKNIRRPVISDLELRTGRRAHLCFTERHSMYEAIVYNIDFYRRYAISWWTHMGPFDYATVLTLIGILGWYWMQGNKKL